jgi:hypothetical protein
MSIQKEFVLRYRTSGHVRFQVPALMCDAALAKALTDGIVAIEGVYRVNFYRGQRKLAIRFNEAFCDFHALAKQLFFLLEELERKGILNPQPEKKSLVSVWKEKATAKVNQLKITRWTKEKITDAKETVQAAKIVFKKRKALVKDPEKAVIDFLNDILVLYLIKMHWTHITQLWLPNPLKYRSELTAMFYMFFLLVRSRKKK